MTVFRSLFSVEPLKDSSAAPRGAIWFSDFSVLPSSQLWAQLQCEKAYIKQSCNWVLSLNFYSLCPGMLGCWSRLCNVVLQSKVNFGSFTYGWCVYIGITPNTEGPQSKRLLVWLGGMGTHRKHARARQRSSGRKCRCPDPGEDVNRLYNVQVKF